MATGRTQIYDWLPFEVVHADGKAYRARSPLLAGIGFCDLILGHRLVVLNVLHP